MYRGGGVELLLLSDSVLVNPNPPKEGVGSVS